MIVPVETQIQQHLQANDAVQDPIRFEEIVSRLEDGQAFERSRGIDVRSGWGMSPVASRGLLVAAAAAVITLLLLGLIPLLSDGEQIPPADTVPPPVPTTVATQDTTGDMGPQPAEDAAAPMVFTAAPSDPVAAEGPLTWRIVELPADGPLRVGLDDRIYLFTQDVIWVSLDGVEWTGYPNQPLQDDSFWSAVGRDRLISAGGGGGIGFSESDEPDALRAVTVAVYDLSELESDGMTLISQSALPDSEGDGPISVAISPQGALVATNRKVYYSEHGDQWTPVETLPTVNYVGGVAATSDAFYFVGETTAYFSTDGVQWNEIGESNSATQGLRLWGDDVVTHDESTIWRITPGGTAQIYRSSAPFDMFGPGDVTGSELGVLAVGLDSGGAPGPDGRGYVYSPVGIKWEQGTLPDGWAVTNAFVEDPIAMNDQTILVIASGPESERGGVLDSNQVLMASP